jgi:HEAT repeat protein
MEEVLAIIARFDGPGFRSREDRARAIEELRSLGMQPFVALLSDPDPSIREQAAVAAIMTHGDLGQDMIVPLLQDSDATIRWYVCGLLYDFGDARAVPALVARLKLDSEATVRVIAADAIGRIAERVAVPESVIPALESVVIHDHVMTTTGFTPSDSARDALAAVRLRDSHDS